MQGLKAFGNGIHAIDSGYTGPDVAAIHLIEEGGRAALVDTGNNASPPAATCSTMSSCGPRKPV